MSLLFTEQFAPVQSNCFEILNAGSLLLVAPLTCPNQQPITATITLGAELTGGETSMDVTSDQTVTILRKGSILTFVTAAADVVVTADTIVTTSSTTVPIEAAPAIGVSDTATTYGMLQVKSPTNIPLNLESQDTNRTDLTYGIQGSMVKVKVEMNNQITAIGRSDDQALYDYIYGAASSDVSVYCLQVGSDGLHGFGRAQVSGWTRDGNIEEIARPQFNLRYQAPWAAPKPFPWLTTPEQTSLNALRSLAGLSALSV